MGLLKGIVKFLLSLALITLLTSYSLLLNLVAISEKNTFEGIIRKSIEMNLPKEEEMEELFSTMQLACSLNPNQSFNQTRQFGDIEVEINVNCEDILKAGNYTVLIDEITLQVTDQIYNRKVDLVKDLKDFVRTKDYSKLLVIFSKDANRTFRDWKFKVLIGIVIVVMLFTLLKSFKPIISITIALLIPSLLLQYTPAMFSDFLSKWNLVEGINLEDLGILEKIMDANKEYMYVLAAIAIYSIVAMILIKILSKVKKKKGRKREKKEIEEIKREVKGKTLKKVTKGRKKSKRK